jgi:hypothetical protein
MRSRVLTLIKEGNTGGHRVYTKGDVHATLYAQLSIIHSTTWDLPCPTPDKEIIRITKIRKIQENP